MTAAAVVQANLGEINSKINKFKMVKRYMGIYVNGSKLWLYCKNVDTFDTTLNLGRTVYTYAYTIDMTGNVESQLAAIK